MKYLIFSVLSACLASAQSAVPDLAQLKASAERGDAVAQFEYAGKIVFSNPAERIVLLGKSASQGYGPAENAIGNHYAGRAPFDLKNKAKLERLAVRFTSRAAFKGIPEALSRLSGFYERGIGVSKDLGLAYGWMAVALKQAGGPNQLSALTYKGGLDRLIAQIGTADIARGRQFEREFRVGGENFVEIDILVRQMKLSAVLERDGKKMVVVNQTRFAEGETKPINIDGEMVSVSCRKIDGKTAGFEVGQYQFRLVQP